MKSLDIGGDAGYQALQCFIRTMVSKDVILIGKDLLLAQASTFLTDTDMTAKAFLLDIVRAGRKNGIRFMTVPPTTATEKMLKSWGFKQNEIKVFLNNSLSMLTQLHSYSVCARK